MDACRSQYRINAVIDAGYLLIQVHKMTQHICRYWVDCTGRKEGTTAAHSCPVLRRGYCWIVDTC